MRNRAPFRVLYNPNSHSFHRQPNFSTISLKKSHQNVTSETNSNPEHQIYTHLLKICKQQCKQVQSRRLFDEMPQRISYASKASKVIHTQSLKFGIGSKGQLGNSIVDLYAKCGNMDFAEKAFHRLENRDIIAWNSILSMYSRFGMFEKVIWSFGSVRNCGVSLNQFTFAIVLSVCARLMNVELGKQVHCNVIKMGFELNSFCEGSLIDMYAKCSHMMDARRIFDGVANHDTVSWTAMIAGYVQFGMPEEALKVFEDMQKIGRVPDQVAIVTVINACMVLGRLEDACSLFGQMHNPTDVAWNVMISGHAQKGYEEKAIDFFQNMSKAGVKSTRPTLGSVLSAIANLAILDYGLQVHALASKQGLDSNVYVGSSLINMYSKCQKVETAKKVFDSLGEKNVVLWNSILGGYAQNGRTCEVMELFSYMRDSGFQPDEFTYTSILSVCACLENLEMGRQLHSYIIKNKLGVNLFVGNALVDMYAKSGALSEARQQFELIRDRDKVSWNAIIVGYVQEEEEDEAFSLFQRMNKDGISPDEVSLASILSACANLQALEKGKQVHCLSIKHGLETSLYCGSSLIDMYAKCGATRAAHEVFISMPERSVVSTNALLSGFSQNNLEKAVNLFHCMLAEGLKPSEITFASLLDSCNGASTLNLGRQIHCFVLKCGLLFGEELLCVSLLSMYLNSREKTDATSLFSELPDPKSAILWTAMISGHAQNDCSEEALDLYIQMRGSNVMPDQATFASILKACAILASLRDGREIHSLIFHTGFDSDELTSSALIDMYAKCGDVKSSVQVFTEMKSKKDVVSWNSMIVGFAKNGCAEDALKIFDEMMKTKVNPDDITFLGVLTACSHAGLVPQGRLIYDLMVNHYKIKPRVDHSACMIDLLGRWGFLDEAEEFIKKLDFEPNSMIWATFLGSCTIHGDDLRGQWAAEKLIELEPQNSSHYVLLSNIYAASGNWNGVNIVRRAMKERGLRKFPGCSWIVVGQKSNLFVAGDKCHPSFDAIYAVLKDLKILMTDEGYVAEAESILHDSD